MPRDDKSFWGLKDPALALALVAAASAGAPAQQRHQSRSMQASSEAAHGQRLTQVQDSVGDACKHAACSFTLVKVPLNGSWLLQATVEAAA